MKNRIVWIVTLIAVLCLVLTACANSAGHQETSEVVQVGDEQNSDIQPSDAQSDDALTGWRLPPENITENPTTVTEATPDSLERTAWMLKDPENADNSIALFFKDGIMTFVRTDVCFGALYEYKNTQLEAYYGDNAYYGEAIEGLLYVLTTDRDGESITRWSNVEDVMQLAKELNGSFIAPYTPEALGIYYDAPYDEDPYEGMDTEVTPGYKLFECVLFTSEIPDDWRVTVLNSQYTVYTIEQPHGDGEAYCYMEVVCGYDYRETLAQRYQGLVDSHVEANFYEEEIGGQTVKVLERVSLGSSAKEIAAVTPSGEGYRLNFYCPDEDESLNFSAILDVMEHFIDHIQFK